jgi:nucleotide-binding universal stress UspA family protein
MMPEQLTAPLRSVQESTEPVVVVGFDGSYASWQALELAAQRAGPDGRVIAVYVTEPVSDWQGRPYYDQAVAKQRHMATRTLARIEEANFAPTTVDTEVIEGDPSDALMRVAEGHDAREIVVGSRGRGRFSALLQSVSHRLLERSDRPVIVVPRAAEQS